MARERAIYGVDPLGGEFVRERGGAAEGRPRRAALDDSVSLTRAAAAAMLFGRAMLPCFASTLGGNFADGFDDDPAAGFLPKNEKRFACFMIPGLGPLGLGGRDRATKSANFVCRIKIPKFEKKMQDSKI